MQHSSGVIYIDGVSQIYLQTATSVNGNLAVTGTVTATARASGAYNSSFSNTFTTGGVSNTRVRISTGGASAGDPFINFGITGVYDYSMGIDNSDSDAWKLVGGSSGGVSSGTEIIRAVEGAVSVTGTITATSAATTGREYIIESQVSDYSGNNRLSLVNTTSVANEFVGGLMGYTSETTESSVVVLALSPSTQSATVPTMIFISNTTSGTTDPLNGSYSSVGSDLGWGWASGTDTNFAMTLTGDGDLDVFGAITATGDITAFYTSDRRLKDNIVAISKPLEKLSKLGGYFFDWNSKSDYEGNDIGLIAQEVEGIIPTAVVDRDTGFKAVRYEKVIPLLVASVNTVADKVERLEKELAELREQL